MIDSRRIVVADVDVGDATRTVSAEARAGVSRRVLARHGVRPIREVTVRPSADLHEAITTAVPDVGDRREAAPTAADVAVVICTRGRAELLVGCLQAVAALDPEPAEVLVVDNATADDSTRKVAAQFGFRCVVERRVGLDRARNLGIAQTNAPIVAFLDDDTRAATWWAGAVQEAFVDSTIGAASGLVLAAELESWAQRAFEGHSGMRKGYERRVFGFGSEAIGYEPQVAGIGANMAVRRSLLDRIGTFDLALDVGTPTSGGGDLDMLFRVYRSGAHILYDPAIFVRHLHRPDRAGLLRQLMNYGVGYRAFFEKLAVTHPDERSAIQRQLRRWRFRRHVRGLAAGIVRLDPYSVVLAMAEAWGARRGASAYHRSVATTNRDVERCTSAQITSGSTDVEG